MATYKQLSYGSSGDEVKRLQELLNRNGANLDTDGQFGSKTQAAVENYQKNNKLTVDGIAGDETWGSLSKVQTPQPETSVPQAAVDAVKGYKPSDAVVKAEQMLAQQLSQKPGAYVSPWQEQLNQTMDAILNGKEFSYDLNGDALHQQYKDQYTMGGKMAMMDTMGQAQAMTGGYGNSYAQNAGQQAYQEYLKGLNEQIPELYQLALEQYQMEGDRLRDRFGMLQQQEALDYGKWQDAMSAWQSERDYLADRHDAERDYDYGKWADERAFGYQQERDAVADRQWQAEFDEAKRQFDVQSARSSGGSSSAAAAADTEVSEARKTYLANDWVTDMIRSYDGYAAGQYGNTSNYMIEKMREAFDSGTLTEADVKYLLTFIEDITPTEWAQIMSQKK